MQKRIYFLPAFIVVFTLLLIGTFLDLQISQAIAVNGNYFTKIFAAFANVPFSITLCVFAAFFFKLAREFYKKKWQKILLIVFSFIAVFSAIYLFGSGLTSYHAFCLDSKLWYLLGLVIVVPAFILGLYLYKYMNDKFLVRNIVIVLIATLFCVLTMEGLKMLAPRVRYTCVSQMKNGLNFYRPWYCPNLTEEEIKTVKDWATANPLMGGEEHKSWPSGHSNIALTSSFILMFFPRMMKKDNLVKYQVYFFYGGFIYFLLIAFSRVFGGAHYLSDTMFSGTFAIMVYFIANEIYLTYFNQKQ